LQDQVSAVVEAELAIDPQRARGFTASPAGWRVPPEVIGCQPTVPKRDPSPAASIACWLVFETTEASGERYFIAFDPDRRRFGVGIWDGPTAWYLGDGGSLLALLEELAARAQ
jgi:hypothetical protein